MDFLTKKQVTSETYTTLKVLFIFIVVAGHYFKEVTLIWVPVAIGLMFFAYTSAFFTTLKYNGLFSKKVYWLQKICRIGVNLLIINLFTGLLCIFLKTDIWSWQAPIHFLGLTGFLEWLHVVPISNPFGGGRWFLTILFLFYFTYPYLNQFFTKNIYIHLLLFCCVVVNFFFNKFSLNFGITSCAFIYGFYRVKIDFNVTKKISLSLTFFLVTLYIILNLCLKNKQFNFLLLFAVFCFFVLSAENIVLPKFVNTISGFLSKSLLEIYLIHGVLFIKVTAIEQLDFLLSLILIVLCSVFLSYTSTLLKNVLFKQHA